MSEQDSQAYQVKEKLAALEAALLEASPEMPQILRSIHSHLKKSPEIVTILSEEDCAVLVQGLKKQTGIEIATTAAKKSPKKAMSKMQVGLDL